MDEEKVIKPDQTLEQLKKKAIEQLDSILPAPLKKSTYTYAELYDKREEVQRFIIPDLLPQEAVCVLIGEDGIGKTQLCSQLCGQIALKRESFLGMKLNAKHNRCLIVATEDSKQKFTSAITKILNALAPGHDPKSIMIDFTEGSDFDDFLTLKKEIETSLSTNFYDIVIIDALSDLFSLIDGDINSNSHARKLLSFFQYLCNSFNTTIIIIHHAAKSKIVLNRKEGKLFVQKTDSQGAGAITQKPRTVLALTHDPKTVSNDGQTYINYLHVVKANLMGKKYVQNAIKLQFDTKTLLHLSQGLIDIEMQQTELSAQQEASETVYDFNRKKPQPFQIPLSQHKELVDHIFSQEEILSRTDLITKLSIAYGVGKTKVESKDGLISYLLQKNLIEKYQFGSYRKTVEQDNSTPPPGDNWEPMEEAPF